MNIRVAILTALAMLAFAANSVLCRLALVDQSNDPMSFTLLRLASGAVALLVFVWQGRARPQPALRTRITAPLMLFSYAILFSKAYRVLSAATGALIVFSSMQLAMMTASWLRGHQLRPGEIAGFSIAMAGFIYLVLPGVEMPEPGAALVMVVAGASFGIYSMLGLGASDPVLNTARNFAYTLPLVVLLFLCFPFQLSKDGWLYAILSGALSSALGYVIWYAALKDLKASTAAIVVLSVPVIATFGGVFLLHEQIHQRLLIATLIIFGGIAIKIRSTSPRQP